MDVSVFESIRSGGICPGAIVISTTGHDSGRVYLVIDVKERFAFLADGRTRSADSAKKKRVTHLKMMGVTNETKKRTEDIGSQNNTEAKDILIREIISEFLKNNENKD